MEQETVTLVVAGLGIGGTLGGIIVGHFLTRSWQRKQWLLDCRKQEYRELVSAITATVIDIIVYKSARDAKSQWTLERLNKLLDTHDSVYKVIADRIYIAKELKEMNILNRYVEILRELRESTGESDPAERMSALIEEIVEAAARS